MAKFYGIIGFANTVETSPGVWINDITEIAYTGDIVRNRRHVLVEGRVNPDINISDAISIVATEFMLSNISLMRYVKWRGANWEIKDVVIDRPRVIIEIGGLYNGPVVSS